MLRKPYLLYLGDAQNEPSAKTAFGLRDWAPGDVIGQLRDPGCTVDLGVPDMTCNEAAARGAGSIVIGVAPVGGMVTDGWISALRSAIDAGLDVVSGLHQRFAAHAELATVAAARGVKIHDIREPAASYPIARGVKRRGRRLLTVGVDCAIGKKYAALAITAALQARGVPATFRATGQTGIMIAGQGVPLDAVVSDFAAGAAEQLSPDNDPGHWDVIEGQGSLFHPAYAGVSLALLHGSQPDAFVLCVDPDRKTMASFPDFPIVDPGVAIARHELEGALTNPEIRCVGLSLNTSRLSVGDALAAKARLRDRFGLPVFDPVKEGGGVIADALVSTFSTADA